MSNAAVHESVFEWRAPIAADLARKERLTLLGLFGSGIALIVWGVVSAVTGLAGDIRYVLVLGTMLAALGLFGALDSRRLRSTVLSIDRMGTLTVSDTKGSASIDLRTVSALSIRRRAGRPQWRWSIEAVQPDGAWHVELGGLASYWNLDENTVGALEVELQRWLTWANGGVAVPSTANQGNAPLSQEMHPQEMLSQKTPATDRVAEPVSVRGTRVSTHSVFEWQPPEHPNKVRNRHRLRIGVIAFALVIAVVAAISEADNGVSAVLLSMFVPVFPIAFPLPIISFFY